MRKSWAGDIAAAVTAAILARLAMTAVRLDITGPCYRRHLARLRAAAWLRGRTACRRVHGQASTSRARPTTATRPCWLVGHPRLDRRLRLQQHAALAQRVVAHTQLTAKTPPSSCPCQNPTLIATQDHVDKVTRHTADLGFNPDTRVVGIPDLLGGQVAFWTVP